MGKTRILKSINFFFCFFFCFLFFFVWILCFLCFVVFEKFSILVYINILDGYNWYERFFIGCRGSFFFFFWPTYSNKFVSCFWIILFCVCFLSFFKMFTPMLLFLFSPFRFLWLYSSNRVYSLYRNIVFVSYYWWMYRSSSSCQCFYFSWRRWI